MYTQIGGNRDAFLFAGHSIPIPKLIASVRAGSNQDLNSLGNQLYFHHPGCRPKDRLHGSSTASKTTCRRAGRTVVLVYE
jgi:hypothetical protein